MVPWGADSGGALILNKLLKILDAQNYQNAGNAVFTHVLHTRNLRRMGPGFGCFDPTPDFQVGNSEKDPSSK